MPLSLKDIDSNWTLFLDRDGVINYEKQGFYITNWTEFLFLPQVPESIAFFKTVFGRIVVTTNQRGVAKGLMSLADLEDIHSRMQAALSEKDASVDKIYFCLDGEASSPCRKPNPGMALQAASEFPGIDLRRSVMVGNNLSDMMFGRNAGMFTVFVTTTHPDFLMPNEAVDLLFSDLAAFAAAFPGGLNS